MYRLRIDNDKCIAELEYEELATEPYPSYENFKDYLLIIHINPNDRRTLDYLVSYYKDKVEGIAVKINKKVIMLTGKKKGFEFNYNNLLKRGYVKD